MNTTDDYTRMTIETNREVIAAPNYPGEDMRYYVHHNDPDWCIAKYDSDVTPEPPTKPVLGCTIDDFRQDLFPVPNQSNQEIESIIGDYDEEATVSAPPPSAIPRDQLSAEPNELISGASSFILNQVINDDIKVDENEEYENEQVEDEQYENEQDQNEQDENDYQQYDENEEYEDEQVEDEQYEDEESSEDNLCDEDDDLPIPYVYYPQAGHTSVPNMQMSQPIMRINYDEGQAYSENDQDL